MHNDIYNRSKLALIPSLTNNWRPGLLSGRFLAYCLLLAFILKIFTLPLLFSIQQNIFFADITKTAVMNLINAERKTLGLPELRANPVLDKAAMLKAKDMLAKDYFSHQSPDGVSPWSWFKTVGYRYNTAGENLAIGFVDSEEVYKAWMNSPSHKANILNQNFQETGVAVLQGEFNGNTTTIVVNLFGKPQSSAPAPIKEAPKSEPQTSVSPTKIPTTGPAVSGIIEEPVKINPSKIITKEDAPTTFNFLSFISARYYDLIQKAIYIIIAFIIIALLINIFVRIDIQYPDLILKTVGCIAILAIFSAIDKITLINLVPHGFGIQ